MMFLSLCTLQNKIKQNSLFLPHQSSSGLFFPCMASCLCLNASASPPAMLPLLSLGPPSPLTMLAPLPLYPESLAESSFTAFLAAGRFAGGAGGFAFPFVGVGLAGGAGGGGGGAGARWMTSSRYAEGAQPLAVLSSREASHHPIYCQYTIFRYVNSSMPTNHCFPSA